MRSGSARAAFDRPTLSGLRSTRVGLQQGPSHLPQNTHKTAFRQDLNSARLKNICTAPANGLLLFFKKVGRSSGLKKKSSLQILSMVIVIVIIFCAEKVRKTSCQNANLPENILQKATLPVRVTVRRPEAVPAECHFAGAQNCGGMFYMPCPTLTQAILKRMSN